MTKVSVIMPVYNAERHLAESLHSALGQDIRDIEVICVNDGSQDGSLALLRKFADADSRVRIIDCENGGPAMARNAALGAAKGDFVAFLDSDDRYARENSLSMLYAEATRRQAAVCGGRMTYLHTDGTLQEVRIPPFFGFQSYLFSRALLEDGKIRFPNYRVFEDPPFLVAALAHAHTVSRVDDVVYHYRVSYKGPVDWAGAAAEKAKDALRGMIDVARLARNAGMESVSAALDEYCRGNDVRVIAGRLALRDAAAMELLCRLDVEVGGPLLPVLDEIRKVALAGSSPYSSMCHLLRLIKQAVGRHVPDGVKFWR